MRYLKTYEGFDDREYMPDVGDVFLLEDELNEDDESQGDVFFITSKHVEEYEPGKFRDSGNYLCVIYNSEKGKLVTDRYADITNFKRWYSAEDYLMDHPEVFYNIFEQLSDKHSWLGHTYNHLLDWWRKKPKLKYLFEGGKMGLI